MNLPSTPAHAASSGATAAGGVIAYASYSRFLLPFAYSLQSTPGTAFEPAIFWDEATPGDWLHCPAGDNAKARGDFDKDRRSYFTHETCNGLFDRSKWLVLRDKTANAPDGAWKTLNLPRWDAAAPSTFAATVRHPALVLFEWPDDSRSNRHVAEDVLQTGLLVLDVAFSDAPNLADVLWFNEIFRYWRRPYAKHADWPKNRRMLEAIAMKWDEPTSQNAPAGNAADERRLYQDRWDILLRHPLRSGSGQGCSLVPADDTWEIHADSRAFVATRVIVQNSPSSPTGRVRVLTEDPSRAADLGAWVKLLNVDEPGTPLDRSTAFENEWVIPRTYLRWAHDGTVHGFTSHSAAMLAGFDGEPPPKEESPFWRHFREMYFDQLLLMLYLRATVFRFRTALTRLSIAGLEADRRDSVRGKLDARLEFQSLRTQFDWFTNLYRFPILSNQQQAVEMFGKLRGAFDITTLYAEVEEQIDGTHEVLELEAAQQFALVASILGVMGMLGLFIATIQTVLAFGWLDDKGLNSREGMRMTIGLILAVVIVLAGIVAMVLARRRIAEYLLRGLRLKPRRSSKGISS